MTDRIDLKEKTKVSPGERAPEKRRRALLDSAIEEFSTFGLGGARVDRIADRAHTNKAMVYHYFGSKDELYLAALRAIYADIRNAEAALELDPDRPAEAISRLVEFTFRYYIEHPGFVRLINTENLHGASHLKGTQNMTELNRTILDQLGTILDRGVEQGVFRPGIDVLDLYISISALGFTYVSNRHTLEVLFGRELLAKDRVEARLATIKEMILRYLRAD